MRLTNVGSNLLLGDLVPYVEQFKRVMRFLERVRDHSGDTVDYDDNLWSFFQNAWHLKDWIENDPTIPDEKTKRILKRVYQTPDLVHCQDLANRTKHFKLKSQGNDADFTSRNVSVKLGPNPPVTEYSHIVTMDDGSQLVAQDLAEYVVLEWEAILGDEGLEIPTA